MPIKINMIGKKGRNFEINESNKVVWKSMETVFNWLCLSIFITGVWKKLKRDIKTIRQYFGWPYGDYDVSRT